MKLQFEIEDKYLENIDNMCKFFMGINLENTEQKGCSIALINHKSTICNGFLKGDCPLKQVRA